MVDPPEMALRSSPKTIFVALSPEDYEHIHNYMHDHLNCDLIEGYDDWNNTSQLHKNGYVCKFLIHFIVQILQIVCHTERRFQFSYLPRESNLSKNIAILGLYEKVYKNTGKLKHAAIHPNSNIPKDVVNIVDYVCHIHTNDELNVIQIDFYNSASGFESIHFKSFFKELQLNIRDILSKYCENILQYHYLEPERDVFLYRTTEMREILNNMRTEVALNNIGERKMSITCQITEKEINFVDIFLRKINPDVSRINVEDCAGLMYKYFITDVLSKIYALKLGVNPFALYFPFSKYSFSFCAFGEFDTNFNRTNLTTSENRTGLLYKEIKKSYNVLTHFLKRYNVPFYAIIHISFNVILKTMTVDIYNLRSMTSYDGLNSIYSQLRRDLQKIVSYYFQRLPHGHMIFDNEHEFQ